MVVHHTGDITPSSIVLQVVEVNKYFHYYLAAGALLSKQKDSCKPQHPEDTHWSSQMYCTQTYLTDQPFTVLIVATDDSVI